MTLSTDMLFSESLNHLIRENEPLAQYTWLNLGGNAKYFAEPHSLDEFRQLIQDAAKNNIPIRILGDGANLLVCDDGVDGLVIRLDAAEFRSIEMIDGGMKVRAGARMHHVISQAVGAGLSGLEQLAGIPGSIGGIVACNAGIKNDDIGSRVRAVTVIDRAGSFQVIPREALKFGFRRSNLADVFIAEVELALKPGSPVELTRRMQSNWILRRAAQPQSGSRMAQVFIEPDGTNLADVLEESRSKGDREGDVSLSTQHPGFVVVSGEARSEQVLALVNRVMKTVEVKTGVRLQSQLKIW